MNDNQFVYEELKNNDITQCALLCNELMAFQKSKAFIAPEMFDHMNFETRMLKSFKQADASQTIIVKDANIPIAYVFSTIDTIVESDNVYPLWAPKNTAKQFHSFYPEWVTFPQRIGCLNNLYIHENYRQHGIGTKLFSLAINWLESFDDVDLLFVFISNGNDEALQFYLNHGFVYSHDVFGGFIKALFKKLDK